MMSPDVTPSAVLEFWRGAGHERWFDPTPDFDKEVRERFSGVHEAAAAGRLGAWEDTAEGALALVIVLDQFSRNMFRGTARAFSADPIAREVSRRAIARGFDREVEPAMRSFFYMPFMHSENLADQDYCLETLSRVGRRGRNQVRGDSSRCDPALRTLSSSQRNARTQVQRGRDCISRSRRIPRIGENLNLNPSFRLSLLPEAARHRTRPSGARPL